MRRIFPVFVLSALCMAQLHSQIKPGYHILGPNIGFGTKGSAIIYGANYEYELPQAGIGNFAAGALLRFWQFSEKFGTYSFDITSIAFGGQINYNFNQIGTGKFVPFVGLFAGYQNVSTKYTAYDSTSLVAIDQKYKSAFQIWGQAGMRYFFTPKIAGVVRLGLGNLDFSTVEIGADFRF